ncbi:MAG: class I tRNA ligase family protein, partial [Candidatus Marinimicrobia bacterium]|nr:class I tRNA ligase family protein [Candidatus Neomarinimicrobiota bacterium]
EGPLFSDSDFSKERFYQTYNTDLANNFGNLVNRIFKLIKKNFNGIIPDYNKKINTYIEIGDEKYTITDFFEKFLNKGSIELIEKVYNELEHININAIAEHIISYVSRINNYLELTEPWKLAKTDLDATATVLYSALASLRLSASLLYPLLPEKMTEFFSMLNNGDTPGTLMKWDGLKPGTELGEMKALFPRFDMQLLENM